MYVADTQQGDEAGGEGAKVAVESWVPVSAQREVGAGEAGYRDAAVQDGDIREWVFLARTRGAADDILLHHHRAAVPLP